MEKNANLHRESEGGVLRASITGEMGDVPGIGGLKGTDEKYKNSEAPLTSLVNDSCNNRSTNASALSIDAVVSSTGKSDIPEAIGLTPVLEDTKKRSETDGPFSGSGDQISNGTGHDLVLAVEDREGGASKLVNNKTDDQRLHSSTKGTESQAQSDVTASNDGGGTKLAKPTHLCPDNTTRAKSADHTSSEALPSESDPDPSLGGESRSIDSLESFSNLNSCPSSDLNSEGLEDRGLALALQSELGAEGAKPTCTKDRTAGQSIYHIKWIKWREENTPIITQNENGPCPLLAIMNVLLLAWKVKMPPMMEIITAEQLMEYLGDYILETKPKEISEAQRLNYEQVKPTCNYHCG